MLIYVVIYTSTLLRKYVWLNFFVFQRHFEEPLLFYKDEKHVFLKPSSDWHFQAHQERNVTERRDHRVARQTGERRPGAPAGRWPERWPSPWPARGFGTAELIPFDAHKLSTWPRFTFTPPGVRSPLDTRGVFAVTHPRLFDEARRAPSRRGRRRTCRRARPGRLLYRFPVKTASQNPLWMARHGHFLTDNPAHAVPAARGRRGHGHGHGHLAHTF